MIVNIDLKNGCTTSVETALCRQKTHWTESHLEAALRLAPQALEFKGPCLSWTGGTNELRPDQFYVDGLGRAHIVELKRVRASLEDCAQLLAYGDIFRKPPRSELGRWWVADEVSHQRAIERLQRLSGSKVASLEKNVSTWKDVDELRQAGNLAPRLLLCAPDFEPVAVKLARELQKRGVSIELWKLSLCVDSEYATLQTDPVCRDAGIERRWQIARRLWQSSVICKRFEIAGFACHLSYRAFRLDVRNAPQFGLYVDVKDDKDRVAAYLPHSVCDRRLRPVHERTLKEHLRRQLDLPAPIDGDYWWEVPDDARGLGDKLGAAFADWAEGVARSV